MHASAPMAMVVLGLALAGAPGCGLFDSKSTKAKTPDKSQRCDIDIDGWKARVKSFKNKKHQNKESFGNAKDALVRDLQKLDTKPCQRELRHEVSDLIEQVKQTSF